MENYLDTFAHNNKLNEVSSHFKVLFAVLTMIICLLSPTPIIPLLVFILFSSILIILAEIPPRIYVKYISVPFFFAIFTFIFMTLFFGTGTPWIELLSLGSVKLIIYQDGLKLGLTILGRILGAFACLMFITFTTPMTELFSMLQSLRIPLIIIELAMLMYRFIFLFHQEGQRIYHAQKTRLGYLNWKSRYKCLGILAGTLFIRTWLSGERAYLSMESRGYNGSIRPLKNNKRLSLRNVLMLLSFELILVWGVYLTSNLRFI